MSDTISRFRTRTGSFFSRGYNSEGITNLREFLEAREMDYQVHKQQVSIPAFENAEEMTLVDNQYIIRRDSDGAVVSPQTVSRIYGEISPLDMLEDLAPFVEEGWATPDSAFTVRQGAVENVEVIALRLKPEGFADLDTKGEKYNWYLVARNYHGRGSAMAAVFGEREICTNGMTALCKESGFEIVHRGKVRNKYKQAFQRWEGLRNIISQMASQMNLFMANPIQHTEAVNIFRELIGIRPGEDVSDRKQVTAQKANLLVALVDAFNMPRYGTHGRTCADVYNATTWVGTHWTPSRSTLSNDDITVGLLEGKRGQREQKVLKLLDKFIQTN